MGLRFRKRISSGKFLRINLSTSGISLGLGPPGLNVNIGPRGIRRTVGLPGSGIYYQDSSQWPASGPPPPVVGGGTPGGSRSPWTMILVVLVVVVLIGLAMNHSTGPARAPTANPTPASAVNPVAKEEAPSPLPLPDRALSATEIRELQMLLSKRGFEVGPADGVAGPRTRMAVVAFMKAQGENNSGDPTLKVLERALNANP
jgi:hypothetical protein